MGHEGYFIMNAFVISNFKIMNTDELQRLNFFPFSCTSDVPVCQGHSKVKPYSLFHFTSCFILKVRFWCFYVSLYQAIVVYALFSSTDSLCL